jgi:hypothetical protein
MIEAAFATMVVWFAQAGDPTAGLPAWLGGGTVAGVLGFLLYRSEKARTLAEERHTAAMIAERARLDACEERARSVLRDSTERTYDAVAQLGRAVEIINQRGKPDG